MITCWALSSLHGLSTAAPALNTWVHLVGVYNAAAGQLQLYVNGTLSNTTAFAEAWNANKGLQVGRGLWASAATDFFPGAIDDVRTFGRVLRAAEITSAAALSDNLVASYAMDEGSGMAGADDVGGHTLTLSNAGWGAGFSGSALTFNGSSATATAAGFLNTSDSFSVAAWVLLDDINGWHTALSQEGTAVSGFFLQYSLADDSWAFSVMASDAATATTTRALASLPPRLGAWQHLAGVYDTGAGELRLYVDGRRAGTAAFSSGWNAGGAFVVGRGFYNDPTDGSLAASTRYIQVLEPCVVRHRRLRPGVITCRLVRLQAVRASH
ncbi:MAG: LamG domain-containing protein [Solirubrobacteraceae bacterium]